MQQQSLFDEGDITRSLSSGYRVGVDEVGRGPLIGEVVAAAVILPPDCRLALMDSKKLSESKRDQLAVEIKQQALAYAICSASPEEIDELNILHATMLAMRRAVNEVADQVNDIGIVLVDGNRCPGVPYPCEAIVKGDAKVAEISAASILAKVYRDQQMMELDKLFPEYGFAQHKGYPTASHLAAIEKFGLIGGYRKSFKPIKNYCESD
ncbi:ribonuclease HII [Thiomicrorhabdus sp.]|uniref:ribonuclease HII n=1 Tax=Thiomicrorhabdus sp. TaxID=2039724 RepID=UPI003569FDAB